MLANNQEVWTWTGPACHEDASAVTQLTSLDRPMNEDVWRRVGVTPIMGKIRQARLRWYWYVQCSEENLVVRTALCFDPGGCWPRGRPKMLWMDSITRTYTQPQDNLDPDDVHDAGEMEMTKQSGGNTYTCECARREDYYYESNLWQTWLNYQTYLHCLSCRNTTFEPCSTYKPIGQVNCFATNARDTFND